MDIAVLGIKSIPATGGADRVVEKLLENASPQHDYWVYVRRDSPDAARCAGNLHFVHVPALRGKHLGSLSFFFMCCVHYLLKGRYDLAHVHNSDFGMFVPLLRLRPGTPVLGTFHGDPYARDKWGWVARSYLRWSELCFVEFCHRLTSVSSLKNQARGLTRTRSIDTIPNGVDPYAPAQPAPFDPGSMDLLAGSYLFFAAGRLDKTKGLHTLLQAYAEVPGDRPLLVVGDFAHDAAYSQQIRETASRDPRVRLHEQLLDRETLLSALFQCRAFVFPSEYEAMSMILLEAISCRAPILCSDIPENRAVVGEDYPYAFRTGDAAHLASQLEHLLADDRASGVVDALCERCLREQSWPRVVVRYEEIYGQLRPDAITTPTPSVS